MENFGPDELSSSKISEGRQHHHEIEDGNSRGQRCPINLIAESSGGESLDQDIRRSECDENAEIWNQIAEPNAIRQPFDPKELVQAIDGTELACDDEDRDDTPAEDYDARNCANVDELARYEGERNGSLQEQDEEMGDERKGRDGDDRLKGDAADLPNSQKKGRVRKRVVHGANEFGGPLDRDDLSTWNGREKTADHRSLDERPDEEEDDLVENRNPDKEWHIGSIRCFWNRLPIDREAEHIDEGSSGDHQREYMTGECASDFGHGRRA